MYQQKPSTSAEVTLVNCDQEPIHIPGSIQPYGVLLLLDKNDLTIRRISANASSILGCQPEKLLGQPLTTLLVEDQVEILRKETPDKGVEKQNTFLKNINPLRLIINVEEKEVEFNGIVHFTDASLVLEIERFSAKDALTFTHFYDLSRKSLLALQSAEELEELYDVAVREVQSLTGFDRVMLYQFDDEWNGDVVAEATNEGVDSYLGLHFPHTDIPAQARKLYSVNWLRYIPDATYQPVPVLSQQDDDPPLDLSYSVLRSVSPIHLEYLANMDVQASMSISLIKDNQLWGLIACHHKQPHFLSYQTRVASEYIGQILSLQLALKQKNENRVMALTLRRIHALLIENITRKKDYASSFSRLEEETLELTSATGAAICHEGNITLVGVTPSKKQITQLHRWVSQRLTEQDNLFHTNHLKEHYPLAGKFVEEAAGLLAVLIAKPQKSSILWFRKEVIQEVNWSGKPDKFYREQENGVVRLHPRRSFDLWKERLVDKSLAWENEHVKMARELGNAIKDIFVFKAEEYRRRNEKLSKLNDDLKLEISRRQKVQAALERSNAELERFAYVASHDLQEPLRAVSNFSMLLKKRYANKIDERADKYIRFIVDGTNRMQILIDDILAFSRIERKGNHFVQVDTHRMIKEVMANLSITIQKSKADIDCLDLPNIIGDQRQLRQLFQNLISNALKYRQQDERPQIIIRCEEQPAAWQFSVSDNGIGIEKEFFDRIFVIFQRLHSSREYSGTGIGLAICQRIVEAHQGKIWVESEFGRGSTFYFTINKHLELSE